MLPKNTKKFNHTTMTIYVFISLIRKCNEKIDIDLIGCLCLIFMPEKV